MDFDACVASSIQYADSYPIFIAALHIFRRIYKTIGIVLVMIAAIVHGFFQ